MCYSGNAIKRSVVLIALAISCATWSDRTWAQRTRTDSPVRHEPVRPLPEPTPPTSPITFPTTDPSSPLGTALASCETGADASEFSLPSAKGEVKLDRCYRGRNHLVCQFNALSAEAKSLLDNYHKIVDANYPEIRDIAGICNVKTETVSNDLQSATEFESRFKTVREQYEASSNCANRIEQSLAQVSFPDMTQGPDLVKSMSAAISGDLTGVSETQGRVSELAGKITTAHKAMLTLEKIHRAMCASSSVTPTTENSPKR
jgi:hypothetical protein